MTWRTAWERERQRERVEQRIADLHNDPAMIERGYLLHPDVIRRMENVIRLYGNARNQITLTLEVAKLRSPSKHGLLQSRKRHGDTPSG